jgi:hypothetical protein
MVERTEGQRQLTSPTIAGSRKAETRRAEVDDRLTFKGGISGADQDLPKPKNRGPQPGDGTNQPLKSGSRGTIVNITA